MARNQTLLKLLQAYRAEIRASGNAAHNTSAREGQVNLLQRVQETLWEEVDWPFLRVERYFDVQAGQRYYDTPEDVSIDRVQMLELRYGQEWVPLTPEIDRYDYSQWDSDLDERSWPVEKWKIHEDEQIELWPVPGDNADTVSLEGRIKITGIRNLRPLVADDDRADLDDRMIVLFAAAETLAASGAKDAPLKLQAAQMRKRMLTASMTKIKSFRMFGGDTSNEWRPKGPPRVHYRTTT
jgi:hypothetical protein